MVEQRLIRTRIDCEEVIASFHEVAFVKRDLSDCARDLRPHADAFERLDIADRGDFDRNVALLHDGRRDWNRTTFPAAAAATSAATAGPIGRSGDGVGPIACC